MAKIKPPKHEQRSWRETSEILCRANWFPPGFKLVLRAKDGTVRKRHPTVMSVDPGQSPLSWSLKVFLTVGVSACIEDDLGDWKPELQNHEGKPIDERLTLRRVREMCGRDSNPAFDLQDDVLCELNAELEECLEVFASDVDHRVGSDPEILLKAIINYVLLKYDLDALETVLDFHKLHVKEKRNKERTRWRHFLKQ